VGDDGIEGRARAARVARAAGIPVVADVERIGQVVTNFLTNALKYSPHEAPVALVVEHDGAEARVSVRDHGPGLSPEAQQHIWERFYRAEGVEIQTGSGVGLGLGLYISQCIVTEHGGHMWLKSKLGAGTTFYFSLPLS